MEAHEGKVFEFTEEEIENAIEEWLRREFVLDGFSKDVFELRMSRESGRCSGMTASFKKELGPPESKEPKE